MIENVEINDFESFESVSSITEKEHRLDKLDKAGTTQITKELIKEVQQELCLIKLCWSEIDVRKDLYLKTLPSSYYTVSGKERVLAWYAENFRRQFRTKYPNRKPLLLTCDNECGIQKFVSATIRRSTLPYPELYTWQGCGKFVSDYIEYEPLEKPFSMPPHLRSPTWIEKFQRGNCFECATFLASLLLGQGYNAFVVSGYASREQTLCDLTRCKCPYLPQLKTRPPTPEEAEEICKYDFKLSETFTSKLLVEEEQKEDTVQDKLRQREEEQLKLIEVLERPPVDKYHGHRIHAWVAILPELGGLRDQEIPCTLFIEPTTGVGYKTTDNNTARLYLGVESIWNDQNYWVNMQSLKFHTGMKWDLTKVEHWEHLLPGEPLVISTMGLDMDPDSAIPPEKHLDMPFSYVNEINISEQNYEKRYPNGMKTILYKKTKVELYAPYVQTDGMIKRITVYDEYDYISAVEVCEYFANRSDNLTKCRKNLIDDSVVDYYLRGRSDQCKEHRYFADSPNTVDSERIIDFYHVAHLNGLSQIELHPNYFTQHFVDRDDLLYYRHVDFHEEKNTTALNDVNYRQIWKIIEKFHRDERIEANKNVAIREFAIGENEIRLTYHYHPDRFSRATRMFIKPPLPERGERLVLNPAMTQGYVPLDEPVRSLDVFYELERQLKEEEQSVLHVKSAEVEVSNFLARKYDEYLTPTLLISEYDVYRERESKSDIFSLDWAQGQSQSDLIKEGDYLKPYLARLGNPTEISTLQAYSIKYDCLNDFKHLLVHRANAILHKFEDYTQKLEKMRTLLLQNDDLSREEEERILKNMNDINFILQTLEIRLDRHRDLVPKRYKMLMDYLQQHPLLTTLDP